MAGNAREKYGLGKKLTHQQDTNKELYNISGAVPTQASSSVVSAGSQGGGTYQNAQSADIYMNTYDIVDIDRLKFAVKEGSGDLLSNTDYGIEALYVSGDAYGMWFRIPAISAEGNNTQYIFYHGDTQMVHISLAEIVLNNDVRIEGFVDVDNIAEPSSPSGGDRRLFVDSGNSDHLSVKKSDGNVVDLEAGGVTNPVNATLSLGGNQITRVTSLFFDGDGDNSHSIQGNTGGINYLVDNTDEYHDFKIDGNIKLRVGNGSIQPTEIIDMQDNGIQNVPHIYLNTDATNEALIDGATNGIDFNVPALDFYQFKFNNVTKWSMTTTQLSGDNIILNQSQYK